MRAPEDASAAAEGCAQRIQWRGAVEEGVSTTLDRAAGVRMYGMVVVVIVQQSAGGLEYL